MAKPVVWDWWLALDGSLRAQAFCADPLITSLFVHLLEKGQEAGQMIALFEWQFLEHSLRQVSRGPSRQVRRPVAAAAVCAEEATEATGDCLEDDIDANVTAGLALIEQARGFFVDRGSGERTDWDGITLDGAWLRDPARLFQVATVISGGRFLSEAPRPAPPSDKSLRARSVPWLVEMEPVHCGALLLNGLEMALWGGYARAAQRNDSPLAGQLPPPSVSGAATCLLPGALPGGSDVLRLVQSRRESLWRFVVEQGPEGAASLRACALDALRHAKAPARDQADAIRKLAVAVLTPSQTSQAALADIPGGEGCGGKSKDDAEAWVGRLCFVPLVRCVRGGLSPMELVLMRRALEACVAEAAAASLLGEATAPKGTRGKGAEAAGREMETCKGGAKVEGGGSAASSDAKRRKKERQLQRKREEKAKEHGPKEQEAKGQGPKEQEAKGPGPKEQEAKGPGAKEQEAKGQGQQPQVEVAAAASAEPLGPSGTDSSAAIEGVAVSPPDGHAVAADVVLALMCEAVDQAAERRKGRLAQQRRRQLATREARAVIELLLTNAVRDAARRAKKREKAEKRSIDRQQQQQQQQQEEEQQREEEEHERQRRRQQQRQQWQQQQLWQQQQWGPSLSGRQVDIQANVGPCTASPPSSPTSSRLYPALMVACSLCYPPTDTATIGQRATLCASV